MDPAGLIKDNTEKVRIKSLLNSETPGRKQKSGVKQWNFTFCSRSIIIEKVF